MLHIPFLVQSLYRRAVLRRLSVVKLLNRLLDLFLGRLSGLTRDIPILLPRSNRQRYDPQRNTPENQGDKEQKSRNSEDDCDLRGVVGRGAIIQFYQVGQVVPARRNLCQKRKVRQQVEHNFCSVCQECVCVFLAADADGPYEHDNEDGCDCRQGYDASNKGCFGHLDESCLFSGEVGDGASGSHRKTAIEAYVALSAKQNSEGERQLPCDDADGERTVNYSLGNGIPFVDQVGFHRYKGL